MLRFRHPGLILIAALWSLLPTYGQQNELRSLATSLAPDIAAAGKRTIAVVDFVDLQGNTSELGRFLAEEFSVALTRTHKGFEVVERNHLKTTLAEHKLNATGLIDPATARQLGQFTGADGLVTGSITPFAEHVRLTVKVLNTDTARIIAADDADLPRTQTISELLGSPLGGNRPTVPSNDRPRPGGSPGPEEQAGQSAPSNRVVAAEEMVFELSQCRGIGGSVRCYFRITNRGVDRDLILLCNNGQRPVDNGSSAYDSNGNGVGGAECSIANDRNTSYVRAHLISGVTVASSVLFNYSSPSAVSLSLVTVYGIVEDRRSGTRKSVEVPFRSVPITR